MSAPPPGHDPYGSQPYGPPQYGSQPYSAGQPQYLGPPGSVPAAHWRDPQGRSLAHWAIRVVAYLIDALVLLPASILVTLSGVNVDEQGLDMYDRPWLYYLGVALGAAIWIWNLVLRQGRTGQSVGKTVMGLWLVGENDGRPIGPLRAFLRQIAHFLDALLCGLGYLWPLWDRKRQTFADKIVNTLVLKS